jgi:uncharacterized protein (DUF305 family)
MWLTLTACSSAAGGGVQTSPEPDARADAGPGATKPKANYPYTEADVRFMSHMINHHAQALVMAGWAASNGANPMIRNLADRIINGQQDEIATMQRWLRDRGQPVPEPLAGTSGAGHSTGHGDHTQMPGMLTDAQMKELEQARGPEFDRLFLTYMIQHHQGGVTMVNNLFGTEGAAQEETTFKLANDVSVDQATEVARMQRMLDALPGGKRSP